MRVIIDPYAIKPAMCVKIDATPFKETGQAPLQGQILRDARGYPRPLIHQPDTVGYLESQIQVMRREENRLVGSLHQTIKQLHDFHLAGIIKESRRLVQEDNRSLLREGLGNHHLLPFAIRERMHHAPRQVPDVYQVYGLLHLALILRAQRPPETGIRTPAHTDQVRHAHVADLALLGQHHANQPAQLLIRIFRDIFTQQIDFARKFGLESGKGAEQGRLPHPIGSQEAGQLSAINRGINMRGYNFPVMLGEIPDR